MDVVNAARWVGVLVAIIGAAIVAPAGARRLAEDAAKRARRTWVRVTRWIRRSRSIHAHAIPPGVAMTAVIGTITTTGSVWPESDDLATKVEALRKRTDELRSMVNTLRADHDARLDKISRELGEATAQLRQAITELHRRQDEAERATVQIDARGLPVIVWGIVLTGVPDDPLRWWLWGWFGWLLIAVALAWTALAVRHAFLTRWIVPRS